jgi:CRISPR-associated protein Cas1
MEMIFVQEPGCRVRKNNQRLEVVKNGKTLALLNLTNASSLVLMGAVEISSALIRYLARRDIGICWLDSNGRILTATTALLGKNSELRLLQYQLLGQSDKRIALAGVLIDAKIRNAMALLERLPGLEPRDFRPRMQNLCLSVKSGPTLDSIRGLEGSASALFFKYYVNGLVEQFGFVRRQKHPPPDPLNIILSFLYTLLFKSLEGFIIAAGLDPYWGFYHELSYGHPALVSDLQEVFRSPVVDRLAATLINKRMLRREHFARVDEQWQLRREGLGILLEGYQKMLATRIRLGEKQLAWQTLMREQVQRYCRFLRGQENFTHLRCSRANSASGYHHL